MTNIVALAVKAYQIYWFLCLLAVSICSFVYLLLLIVTPNNRIKQYEFKTRYLYIYNTLLSIQLMYCLAHSMSQEIK